jgi:sensor c-di-GMP phosphodiesterase-like protein
VSAPRFRNYATPIGVLLITGIVGGRIAHRLQDELGDVALWLGLGILLSGIVLAVWLWRRRAA